MAYAGLVFLSAPFKYIDAHHVLILPFFSTPYSVGSVSMSVSAVAGAVAEAIDEDCCLGIVVVVLLVWISIFYFLSHFDFDFPSREIETTYSV